MKNVTVLTQPRIDWVDYAKGICIIAVVTMYATSNVEHTMQAQGWMHYFMNFAQPFRMPDFFFLSGLFVSRVIDRPWRAYIDTKVLHFIYFYVLWVTLKFLLGDEAHWQAGADWLDILAAYLRLYIQPSGPLWFIYMLPLFFLAVRLVRPIPMLVVLVAAIALYLTNIETGWKLVDRFGLYFVFFYSGHMFAPQVFRMADWARNHARLTLSILVIWSAANGALVWLNLPYVPVVHLLAAYAGAVAVLLLSVLLVRLPWMRWLRYLGTHSIVVFLAFVVPMLIMRKLMMKYRLIADVGTMSLIVVVASITGALLMYWAVRRTPLRFLFVRPAWASIQLPTPSVSSKQFSAY